MKSYFLYSSLALLVGLIISIFISPNLLLTNPIYSYFTYSLLAIGLYGAVYGIDLKELSNIKKSVFLVVTLGVLLKILFIGTVLFLFTGNLISYLLACIVAQIDPLAIAKLSRTTSSKLSQTARSLHNAWASFDDPMTVLIAFYILLPIFSKAQGGLDVYFQNLLLNLFFAGTVYCLDRFIFKYKFQFGLLIVSLILCISLQFMFGIALIGLFLRPKTTILQINFDNIVNQTVSLSYYFSVVILGILVSRGIDLKLGIILGLLAFLAQVLVTFLLLYNLKKSDKITIALSQYNGITSIILSSLVVIYYDQTVAIISVSIITISILYFSTNSLIKA